MTRAAMRRIGLGLALLTAMVSTPVTARMQDPTEGELRRLAESYMQVWAKGDARAVSALYSSDAVRIGPEGGVAVGRVKIEQALTLALNGPYRGSRISVTYGVTTRAAQDAYVSEGTFTITGAMAPPGVATRGRFVQTLVRVSNRWLIAGDGAIGAPRPPPTPAK
jgi:uncharacterized protein (TIGR02246 family)